MIAFNLFGSALWVVGLAITLASLGWRLWQFRVGVSIFGIPLISLILDVGALLFCLGLTLTVPLLWVTILFAILAAAFAVMATIDIRRVSRE